MKRFALFTGLLSLVCYGSLAEGHGFNMYLVNNQITATSGANTVNGLSSQFFVEEFGGSPTVYYYGEHGSPSRMFGSGSGFPAGSSVRIDFNGALWHSTGSGAAPANLDIVMQPYKGSDPQLTMIDGASGPQLGFSVTGTNSHELTWRLLLKSGASLDELPSGVYGWSYTISGGAPGGPFEPSLPLVLAFTTPDFAVLSDGVTRNPLLDPAYLDVFYAAVPEPAACGLAAMGLGALFFARKRLRRKAA
jgi:hypothetical protein